MRTLLGILSGSLLVLILGVTAWGVWFASGWEGGSRQPISFSWQFVLPMIPLAYLGYCLLCAVFDFPMRFLLISGIVAHLAALVMLVAVVVYSIRFPQDSSSAFLGTFLITFAALSSLWLAHFRSVSHQSRVSHLTSFPN